MIVCRMNDAQSRPRREYTPKPRPSFDYGEESNGGYSPSATSPSAYSSGKLNFSVFSKSSVSALDHLCLYVCEAYSQEGMCASQSHS